jgi:hypothetical protein
VIITAKPVEDSSENKIRTFINGCNGLNILIYLPALEEQSTMFLGVDTRLTEVTERMDQLENITRNQHTFIYTN